MTHAPNLLDIQSIDGYETQSILTSPPHIIISHHCPSDISFIVRVCFRFKDRRICGYEHDIFRHRLHAVSFLSLTIFRDLPFLCTLDEQKLQS